MSFELLRLINQDVNSKLNIQNSKLQHPLAGGEDLDVVGDLWEGESGFEGDELEFGGGMCCGGFLKGSHFTGEGVWAIDSLANLDE